MRVVLTAAVLLLAAASARADSYQEHDYILNCSGCHRMSFATNPARVPTGSKSRASHRHRFPTRVWQH